MKKNIKTIKEIEQAMNNFEYFYQSPERTYIKEFEDCNKWTTKEVLSLFDTQTKENDGLPPTPYQYLFHAIRLTEEFWYSNSADGRISYNKLIDGRWETIYLTWSETMKSAIFWRLSRMYESMMVEYVAVCTVHSLYPEAHILTSSDIDLVLGVDIVLVKEENNQPKTLFLHVTKNSSWAMTNIKNKAEKQMYRKDKFGNNCIWKRRFTDSHNVLLYDKKETNTTRNLNGHYLLKTEYIQFMCEQMLNKSLEVFGVEGTELTDFNNYLVNNGINNKGISQMIITV